MKKFQLKNTANSTIVGVYATKAEAIKAMDYMIADTNSKNNQTQEEGLTPFDFTLETVEVDVAEAIDTFDDACNYLNLKPGTTFNVIDNLITLDSEDQQCYDILFKYINTHHLKAIAAINQLFTIAEAWNKADDFTPDFSDPQQDKWYPIFDYNSDEGAFIYNYASYAGSIPRAPFGARLCFKTGTRAEQFGKRFTRLYNEIFML